MLIWLSFAAIWQHALNHIRLILAYPCLDKYQVDTVQILTIEWNHPPSWQNLIPLHGTWYAYMVLIIFFWAWKRVCFVWSASRLLIKSGRKLPTIMERSLCPIKVGQSRRSSHANERETVVVNSLSKMRSSTNSWPRKSVWFLLSLVRIGNMLLSWN